MMDEKRNARMAALAEAAETRGKADDLARAFTGAIATTALAIFALLTGTAVWIWAPVAILAAVLWMVAMKLGSR